MLHNTVGCQIIRNKTICLVILIGTKGWKNVNNLKFQFSNFKTSTLFNEKMENKQIVCEVCGELVDEDKYRRHLNNGHKDKREFRCDLCGKEFTSNYNLQYHVAHHLNERNFVCTECPRAYNTAADLAQHYRIHEKQRDPYKCEYCGLAFQIRSRYNTHMRVHKTERGKGPKECPICSKIVQDLRRHNETVHLNIRNHECDLCHKRFNKKSGLERHFLMVHEQQKNYICDLCGKAFGEKSLLTKHKSRHNSIRTSFYCTVCKKYVGEIKNHYETIHAELPFQCEHCYRRFAKLREYDNHLTSKHTKLRKWLCDLCGKRFVEKYQLKRHFRSHINVNGITEADISKLKPIYIGEDRKERKSPSKTSSNKTKYKKYECSLCGKKFAGKTLLKTHLIRHQNKKENYCNICKIYDDNIKEHYETEHNDLEFTCEICFKKFARSSQLRNHNSTNHTNIGEHSCDICGRIFNNLAAIKSHITVHAKSETMVQSDDDYNVFEQINDFDDEESDYFEHETKPNDIENVNVESIVIKKEPEDEYDNICYEFSPTAISIKSEHLTDQEDIDAFDNDFTDGIKEETAIEPELEIKKVVKKEIDQEIKCNVCDAIFPSKDKFKTHFMSEHVESNKSSFSCKECDKSFKDKKSLNNHFKNVHIKIDCEYCSEKFTSKYEVDKHVKAEHESSDKASLMCSFCGKILMTERNLKLHIQAIHSGDRFPCTICDKKFSYKSAMYRHRDREHKTGRKHKCSKCPQQCATKHELRLHKEHHHNVNRKNTSPEHMCFYCGVCFPSSYVLSRHRRRVHGDEDPEIIRECGICKEVLKDLYWKRKHMAQVHLNGKKLKRTCGYCKTEFELYEEFKAHIESHVGLFICITCGEFHFDAESLKSHQYTHKKIDCNLRKYICDHCGHRLFTKLQLSMHMLKHVKSFEVHYCDICGKGFKFASSLYTHRKYHGEGEFVCTYCGKKFARNSDLVNHIRTHTNEKPFKCQICDRGFSLKQLLQYHQQTHPETRVMFKCKKCDDQVFADKKQLTIHEDHAHPELRPYRCFICDMSFKHDHNLRKHNAHKHL